MRIHHDKAGPESEMGCLASASIPTALFVFCILFIFLTCVVLVDELTFKASSSLSSDALSLSSDSLIADRTCVSKWWSVCVCVRLFNVQSERHTTPSLLHKSRGQRHPDENTG
jgi:hypothetical protein